MSGTTIGEDFAGTIKRLHEITARIAVTATFTMCLVPLVWRKILALFPE
jgi:hypothetical protein